MEPIPSNVSGYYLTVDYPGYAISRTGVLLNLETLKPVIPYVSANGYVFHRPLGADGKRRLVGRHRLLLLTFKRQEMLNSNMVANHLNGIKGDDRIENLEWCSQRENAEHAALIGISTGCTPLTTRNVRTGEIAKYASAVRCMESTGLSRDAILYRVRCGETKVFPEGYQYRAGHSDEPWYIPSDPEREIQLAGNGRPVCLRDIQTGSESVIPTLTELTEIINRSMASASIWLNSTFHPLIEGRYQIKWLDDTRPWREIEERELSYFKGSRRVRVHDTNSGEVLQFDSGRKAALHLGLTVSALCERLKKGPQHVFRDGLRFEYVDQETQSPSRVIDSCNAL